MKLIVEGYPYKAEHVEPVLHGLDVPQNKDGRVRVDYVGYFFNNRIKDCVFFLPKVVLNENNMVLRHYSPEELVDVEKCERMAREDKEFIYGLSVWIYRAVREFQHLNPNNEIVYQNTFSRIDGSQTKVENTLIDVVLSLVRFNNENRDFFMFTLKNIHSGYNRIDWNRTISCKQPLVQGGSPVYIQMVNRKKQVNFDEELLIIYFSILQYIHKKYGFKTIVNYNYELITDPQFDNLLRGQGKTRLRQIKYKYFSDKALALWKHCYAFFELAELINSSHQQNDYMLVKNFNIVFESIIDELLSDKNLEGTYNKEQEDGKIVDHIYAYKGLINEDENIFYIGDSKYYKIGHNPGRNSVYKQYTYARNVIQHNLKLFLNQEGVPGKDYLIYRDPATEGYNITPNFFISARLNEEYDYEEDDLVFRMDEEPVKHFENRLFDRDTLLLQHYDVNFLFVVALYAAANDYSKDEFRKKAQAMFREKIIAYLEDRYQFFSLYKKPEVEGMIEESVEKHFRQIIGKTFRPYHDDQILYLSFEIQDKYYEQNQALLNDLSVDFDIRGYKLGTDPRDEINKYVNVVAKSVGNDGKRSAFDFNDFKNEVFLVGGYRNDNKDQLRWIQKNNLYNVRASVKLRGGSVRIVDEIVVSARYLILYEISDKDNRVYHIYPIKYHKQKSENQMLSMGYERPYGNYIVYAIGEEVQFDPLDLDAVIKGAYAEELVKACREKKNVEWDGWKGTPLYYYGADLLKYKKKHLV